MELVFKVLMFLIIFNKYFQFIGDDKLMLYEKTFLARLKPTVLCEAEGGVKSVAWSGRFVAWASDTGVRVYDLDARCSLGLIKWSRTPE